MKSLYYIFLALFILVGCVDNAYYADREYGAASTDAFDRQIIYKDYRHAGNSVSGLPALHAEPIMETYHSTFSEGFTKESIDINTVGSESD